MEMSAPRRALDGRLSLDVVFGLFLASGVTAGAYCVLAVADLIHSWGEAALGIVGLGVLSFVPSLLAWLAGGVRAFAGPRVRDVRLGVALITGHLAWWLTVIGIELLRDDPSWGWVMRIATIAEPGVYAVGVIYLAARWFWWRRRHHVQLAGKRPFG
jgi:hypothetical protein